MARPSMLLNGLKITLSRPRAILWTYAFNLGFALLFSLRLHAQLNDVLAHSLESERLTSAFDLGVTAAVFGHISRTAPDPGLSPYLGVFFYLIVSFLLVPGTLFCYQTEAPARLAILLSTGFQRFWRFVRIALLTLLTSVVILGPLVGLDTLWNRHVDATVTGRSAFLHDLAGYLVIAFAACVLRLYFDLVEVYTLALGEQLRPNGRPDRRVRRVLLPALRTLRLNFLRAVLSFITLACLGLIAVYLTFQTAMHMLAQPRVWPMFLLAQLGLFCMLFTRFWQRGAETALAKEYPLPSTRHLAVSETVFAMEPAADPMLHHPSTRRATASDPIPPPEPPSPSLEQPDPGIFHHDPPGE